MLINDKSSLLQAVKSYQKHPFHLVDRSPWPILLSFSLFSLALGATTYMHGYLQGGLLLSIAFISVLFSMFLWFSDVNIEASHLGHHTVQVRNHIMIGIELFIISEVFAFLGIFWANFHSALAPTIELGGNWPPYGVDPVNPWSIPFLNTVLLVGSGSFITLGHHAFMARIRKTTIYGFIFTLALAIIFTGFQVFEYFQSIFNISDSVFASAFFCSTGLHGIHVIVGTIFILINFLRLINYYLTNRHHVGLESSIYYWHFVDIVWLFLFIVVYFWPYSSNL